MAVNLSKKKVEVDLLSIEGRKKNFNEIVKGYSEAEARLEASRCLNCANPTCIQGCPAHNNIPLFIKQFLENDIESSYKTIQLTSNMSSICSRVCDQAKQCEGSCIRGKNGDPVAIGMIERYISDQFIGKNSKNYANPQYSDKKIAIIGSGPAGISCALELSKLGYSVTIFESNDNLGGLLFNGIPRFRLPLNILKDKIDELLQYDVEIKTNAIFGYDFNIESLKNAGFAAIFIGVGSQNSKYMGIPGEECNSLITSSEFLNSVAYNYHLELGKNVIVVGGGNAAIDSARTALRLKSVESVSIVYRRTINDMPASLKEIEEAQNEGVIIHELTNPTKILENKAICTLMEQTEIGSDGRRSVRAIDGSNLELSAGTIIYAIGNDNDDYLGHIKEIKVDKRNRILVNNLNQTNDIRIFAAGDVVTGPSTVVEAMVGGINAAKSIHKTLND